MSRFKQGGKPIRPLIVTSGKKRKTEARLANEYGVQRAAAVQRAIQRAAELLEKPGYVPTDEELKNAVEKISAGSPRQRDEVAAKNFKRRERQERIAAGEPLTEIQEEIFQEVLSESAPAPVDLLGDDSPAYPVTTDWAAEDEGWYTPDAGWKCAIFRLKNGSREVLNCPHKHKTPEAARGCAMRDAMGRNKHSDWSDSVWTADARYPWTEGRVSALIDELRAE